MSSQQSQIDRLHRRIRMILAPAVIKTTDDTGSLLKGQININGTPEVIDPIGIMYAYGFHANPLPNTDATALFLAGDRSNPIIVATNHQQSRPRNYKPGEIGIYTDEGDTVTLNRENKLNITSKDRVTVKGTNKVALDTPLTEITKDVKAFGKIDASEGFFKNGVAMGGAGAAGPPGPQGPAGATGATGPTGATGADGNTVLHGTGAPPGATGKAGDFYIDTAVESIYGPKTTLWPMPGTSLIGPQGPIGLTGPIGATGPQGSTGATGATGPQGPIGLTGATGPQGPTGATGAAGAGSYQAGSGIAINTGTTPPTISTAVPYLPIAGGTITGTLAISGDFNASGRIYASGTIFNTTSSVTGAFHMAPNASGTLYGSFWYNDGTSTYLLLTNNNDALGTYNSLRPFSVSNSTGQVIMGHGLNLTGVLELAGVSFASQDANYHYHFDKSGRGAIIMGGTGDSSNYHRNIVHSFQGVAGTGATSLTVAGPCYKPGGGVWLDSSDARLKQGIEDYTTSLDAILKLRPRSFEFNGLAETITGHRYIGLVADEVEDIMPEMVDSWLRKMRPDDDEAVPVKTLDCTALTFALVNAVQELAERLAAVEGRA